MNLRAFARNYTTAASLCYGWGDRLKYLFWLYCPALPFGGQVNLTLRLREQPNLRGTCLTVRCNGGSDAFIFSEIFEHRYYDFRLPVAPQTILDVGANAGFASVFFAHKYPDAAIGCVEPMPDNLRVLHSNIRNNGVSAEVFPNALCACDGVVLMQIADNDYGHKIADIGFGRTFNGGTLEVVGVSVPTIMRHLGWERIGLLKIDIEGYEGVLLRGDCQWLRQVDALCIECHEGFGEKDLAEVAMRFNFLPPVGACGTWLLVRRQDELSC